MGITVLPIHDAVIVPASAVAKAKAVMLDTFKEMTGQDGVVDILTMDGFKKEEEELQLVA